MAFLKFFQLFFSYFLVSSFSAISTKPSFSHILFPLIDIVRRHFHLCFYDVLFYPISYSSEKMSGGIKPAGLGLSELWIVCIVNRLNCGLSVLRIV